MRRWAHDPCMHHARESEVHQEGCLAKDLPGDIKSLHRLSDDTVVLRRFGLTLIRHCRIEVPSLQKFPVVKPRRPASVENMTILNSE